MSSRRRREDPRPSALNRYLLDSERLVFAVRRHAAVLAGAGSIYLVLLAVAALFLWFADGSGVVATIGLIVLLVGSAWFGWKVGDWWVERFTVTDRRVLLVSGLLTRRVAIMPLRKVTDLTFERTFVGRLFGYGAFVMESAGQQQALSRVDFLPRPESLYLQMSDLLFGSGDADRDPDEDGGFGRRPRRPSSTRRPAAAAARTPADRSGADLGAAPRAAGPRVMSRPPTTTEPSPGTPTSRMGATDPRPGPPPRPQVQSPGSPPAAASTSPLPSIARDRPLTRRPRGRYEPDPRDRGPGDDMA